MIIVQLQGGLGNQMFQYALGRKLSLHHKTELKLDLTFLLDRTPKENFTYRNYELGKFNICATIASESDLKRYRWKDSKNRIYRRLNAFIRYPFQRVVKEKNFHFDEKALNCPANTYLSGYWQSYKYFSDIENVIRSDFSFPETITSKNRSVADNIMSSVNSICVYVRRGDFVTNPNTTHGVCGKEYFFKAMSFMKEKIRNPQIYVFSDDMEWCRSNLIFDNPTFFVNFDGNSQAYLHLLSLCKHFIIPNSTFGWWAAWLSSCPDKIIAAPKKWFNNPAINTSDLIPDTWHRL